MSHRLTALCFLILAAAVLATGLALSRAFAAPISSEMLDADCTAGKASSCALLAVRYRHGRELPKDEALALKYAQKGCASGSKFACGYAGDMTYRGQGTGVDKSAGEAMMRSACASGDYWSCDALRRHGLEPEEMRQPDAAPASAQ